MRPIKFRVRDLTNGMWIRHDGDSAPWAEVVDLGAWQDETRFAISQYTGLKDKDGKDIWEGDIVDVDCLNASKGETWRAPVIWGDSGWDLQTPSNGTNQHMFFWRGKMVVIGNQWDTPTLLA